MSQLYFHPGEIFAMAQEIERNGARFYRTAAEGACFSRATAEKTTFVDLREMLLGLAAMEDEHEKTFAAMQQGLAAREGREITADEEAALYLRAWADGHVFAQKAIPLTGKETREEILKKAIGLEKDSIAFYVGIKEAIPPEWGREKIDVILREEMSHIRLLDEKLSSLSS
jgi:rubrerythrin